MRLSTDCSSSSSSGTIDSQDLIHAIENLSLSSSTEKSSASCCSVADRVISDIDVLTLILICLPVKTLLVFKSISKQWYSLISDKMFAVNNFRRLNPKITGLFFQNQPAYVDKRTGMKLYTIFYFLMV
ncbi:hypothetical protein MKW94_028027, partial [Papaver nudicaule]|nr:hypothetical protein [Papaver nudicaule]